MRGDLCERSGHRKIDHAESCHLNCVAQPFLSDFAHGNEMI
jgi:hypothetical protein